MKARSDLTGQAEFSESQRAKVRKRGSLEVGKDGGRKNFQRSVVGSRRSGKDTPVEHPVREPGSTGQGGRRSSISDT